MGYPPAGMLTKLSVKNFRLLRDVSIDVEPGKPIVLIGPNSSGKSSLLQVLDLLGRWATEGFDAGLYAFGGSSSVVTNGLAFGEHATIDVHLDSRGSDRYSRGQTGPLRYEVGLSDTWLVQERLSAYPQGPAEEPLQLAEYEDGGDHWIWNEESKSQNDLKVGFDVGSQLFFQLVKQSSLYPTLERLRSALTSIAIYDGFLTTPLWARDAREGRLSPFDSALVAPVPRIDRRGLNLVNALYHLQSNHGDEWDELIHAFRAEFPFVSRLEFPADPAGGRVALGWRDQRYPGVRMQGHQMSEGMTSYLCLLAAVLCPEPTAVIAFDEPDAHLHPSAMRRLVYLLERVSTRTAVFIATHSDRLLDFLSDPAGSLRVCEPSRDGVAIRTLDRQALDEWREDYSLSQLRERGYLDPANASAADE